MDPNKDRQAPADLHQGLPPAPWPRFSFRAGGNDCRLRPNLNWHDTTIIPVGQRPGIQARPVVVD